MFSDPQSITVNSVAQSLPAISRNGDNSVYQKDDATYKMTIAHQYKTERTRVTVRVDANKTAADPLVSANNRIYSQSAYIVIDKPAVGYSNTEAQQLASALTAWATSANLLKVLGGET
ncbi:coat protein [ssRNA phage Zoerhiza.2_17]|jgi:hypothetical protein|uniref:Coat protein n=2 Tax=Leviviricetes TaxID=2842243 RepID=A0A8S5KY97_9VIRU|nr:coat protein [ssRNA phage Zoerhiza.2_17]QDH89244.1 MAG: hypothetical protein H2Rhizo32742_000002 [Leviviridae sp.]DAD50155.1 TPA_asm: coat protein [ssRNA phage Zoerhiza.2_17]